MKDKQYLSAKEAAAELDITLPTLYAYVSRGLIRSEESAGKSRAKRYARADVAALKARQALRRNPAQAAEQALDGGLPILESALTLIEDGRLYYRGQDVLPLPDQHRFEAVASWLWQGAWSSALWTRPLPDDLAQTRRQAQPLLAGLTAVESFQVVLPLAAARDLGAYDWAPQAVMQTAVRILQLETAVAGQPQAAAADMAETLARAWAPQQPAAADLINAALIYCADHELNVSAFTARVVASAAATPYGVALAGLAALQGGKHGGITGQVAALLGEVETAVSTRHVIANRLKRGDAIPGFGHKLYPEGDPRGRALLARLAAALAGETAVQQAAEIVAWVETATGLQPNIDFALTTLARALGLPADAPLTLFALGRSAGWMAHALEQYGQDQLIRPRARYVGLPPAG